MSTITHKSWCIKDEDGNTIGCFEGTADSAWIGRELLDGSVVASVEQLADVVEPVSDPEPPSTADLLNKIEALEARIEALEA